VRLTEFCEDPPCIKNPCILYPFCKRQETIRCQLLFGYISLTENKRLRAFEIFPKTKAINTDQYDFFAPYTKKHSIAITTIRFRE